MDDRACMRIHYSKQQQLEGQTDDRDAVCDEKQGGITKASEARKRICQAVDKYTAMLPEGETVVLVVIPAHGSSKVRLAGSASIQEIIAVLTALSKLPKTRRKNLTDLLDVYKLMLAEMDAGDGSCVVCALMQKPP